jgi:hypothetical protein
MRCEKNQGVNKMQTANEYLKNASVTSFRLSGLLGRYMIIPTHENTSLGDDEYAGLIGAVLRAVHLKGKSIDQSWKRNKMYYPTAVL